MKIYIYARTSTGEEAAALDIVKLFNTREEAVALFKKDRDQVEDSLSGWEITYEWGSSDQWEITIRDNGSPSGETTFRGFILIEELN